MLTWQPLSPDTWDDFAALAGERGLCGGCWCMFWRTRNKDFQAGKGEGNKAAMKVRVDRGERPGILAYREGRVIGWCSVAPRGDFIRLETSKVLAPVDDTAVWSLSCLFVEKGRRREGISRFLIGAACDFARGQGAKVLEAYPIIPKKEKVPDAFSWTGFARVYSVLGFKTVKQRSDTRPIMRITL